MTGKKNFTKAIKRAVPLLRQASTVAELQLPLPNLTGLPATTPFTRYVLDNLNLQNGEYNMFAMSFAAQIQIDCEAKVLDFDDYHHLLGHKSKADALRTLKRTIEEDELVFSRSAENSVGRPRDVYMLNINQIEEVLLAANTDEGKKWRKLVLKIKNLVVQFMKMEMEATAKLAQLQLEEQTSKLTIKNLRLQEMEAVHTKLQATIESQRKRDEKKEARKRQQKQPTESTYLISNNPGGEGPFKCGMTEKEAKQRAKAMQTGNHEPVVILSEVPCVKAEVIEKVMHQIFYDYRTNDKLEWFDAPLESMKAMTDFLVQAIDGFSRVDHDRYSVAELLKQLTGFMEETISNLPLQEHFEEQHMDSAEFTYEYVDDKNIYALFCQQFVHRTDKDDNYFTIVGVKDKWPVFSDFLITNGHASQRPPLPKLQDLRDGLSSYLNLRCEKDKKIPRTRKHAKSAFFYAVLLDRPRDGVYIDEPF